MIQICIIIIISDNKKEGKKERMAWNRVRMRHFELVILFVLVTFAGFLPKASAIYGLDAGRPIFDIPIIPALIPFSAFIFVRFGEQIVPFQAKQLHTEYDYIIGMFHVIQTIFTFYSLLLFTNPIGPVVVTIYQADVSHIRMFSSSIFKWDMNGKKKKNIQNDDKNISFK